MLRITILRAVEVEETQTEVKERVRRRKRVKVTQILMQTLFIMMRMAMLRDCYTTGGGNSRILG